MRFVVRPPRSEWASVVARPSQSSLEMIEVVAPIFDSVRSSGDDAIRDFTARFDGVEIDALRVPASDIDRSASQLSEEIRSAIHVAAANIERFHRAMVTDDQSVETAKGVKCWRRSRPIRSVGLYVPGGSAPLLSTVLMLGIPARVAGCPIVQLCTPPGKDGTIDPSILYASRVVGIERVFRIGGAQAIAALTFGTASIAAVDKIFGPGNQYVTAAKQYASLHGVAIDLPAGPTEVAIVADAVCPVDFVVFDVLAQAEHGPDSHVVLVTTDETYARRVVAAVESAVDSIPRNEIARRSLETSVCVVVEDHEEAIALCNSYAPEHLILATLDARELAENVESAGSVFVGMMTPESAGDYASGTNHTLPTGGAARAYSGVSVDSFVKRLTFQELTEEGLRNLGPTIVTLALAEGLDAHGRAVSVRTEAAT